MKLQINLHELTPKQNAIYNSKYKHHIIRGPAGTAKTYIALARALKMISQNKAEKIIIVRSNVETRPMGFLPGDAEEKMEPFCGPYVGLFNELSPKRSMRHFMSSGIVEVHPTSFLRGITFRDAIVIVDEFQNMSAHELETVITRLDDDCHLILCGDSAQSDLKYSEKDEHKAIMRILYRMDEFAITEFGVEDIVRGGLVRNYYIAKMGLSAPEEDIPLPASVLGVA